MKERWKIVRPNIDPFVQVMDIVIKVESSKVENGFLGAIKADRQKSGELKANLI